MTTPPKVRPFPGKKILRNLTFVLVGGFLRWFFRKRNQDNIISPPSSYYHHHFQIRKLFDSVLCIIYYETKLPPMFMVIMSRPSCRTVVLVLGYKCDGNNQRILTGFFSPQDSITRHATCCQPWRNRVQTSRPGYTRAATRTTSAPEIRYVTARQASRGSNTAIG